MSRVLPHGRVTFAFVDVVESTKLFAEHGDAFVAAMTMVQERIAHHTLSVGGVVVKTEGDGAFLAFPSAAASLLGLTALQAELAEDGASRNPRLEVRAGAHTGDAMPVGDDYIALAVNVAARVASTAGAGQVVVSQATQAELPTPAGVCVGEYVLKDVADPVVLWRVCGDETPLRASASRRTNVRIPVTGFVGRGPEMAQLDALVTEHRLVTVLGPGGLGKTRLVTELVLQVAKDIEGGAWMVELASVETDEQVVSAVGRALGIRAGTVDDSAAEVRRRGRVLLVLDNCEHVIDTAADVAGRLRDAAPGVRVLCTSREPLQVPGEKVWRLPPLDGTAARIELFMQRAWASGGAVSDESEQDVTRLCAALDGLPLAIELAATQSGHTPLSELVRVVERGSDSLVRRGGEARQRSLDAVLDWSLSRLSPERRAALLVLSVLPGRFDIDMATAILEAVDVCETSAVRPLARCSLLDLDGDDYRMLDTIRHAARRHLTEDPDLARAARLGLRLWASRWAAAAFRVPRANFDDVPADQLLALETALEQAVEDGATGIGKLWELVRLIGVFREPSARITELAVRTVSGKLPEDPDEVLCMAAASKLLLSSGIPLPLSPAEVESIADAADRLDSGLSSASLHCNLAVHYLDHDRDLDAARRHAAAYIEYAGSSAADPVDKMVALNLRQFLAYAVGDHEEALVQAVAMLDAARRLSVPADLETAEANVAEALLDLGRPQEALPYATAAVGHSSRFASPMRRFALLQLARAHADLGDVTAAQTVVSAIEDELRGGGLPPGRLAAELHKLRSLVVT